jgi:hypothetical protein
MHFGIFRDIIVPNNMMAGHRSFILQNERRAPLPLDYRHIGSSNQYISRQSSHKSGKNFIIYHGMWEFGKILNTSGKVSTKRAENFFPKYLLYYLHEIARKYPKEKKYSSSFYDSPLRSSTKKSIYLCVLACEFGNVI